MHNKAPFELSTPKSNAIHGSILLPDGNISEPLPNIITYPPPSDFEIDSFRLKIPYDKCTILDYNLEQLFQTVNTNTGEVIKESINNKINVGTDYMKLWIQIAFQNYRSETRIGTTKPNTPRKYLIITIHSKLLKNRYLDRITNDNIELVYNSLMSYKVFECTFVDFVNSEVLDIDFCRNVQIPLWNETVQYIKEHVKKTSKLNHGMFEFNKKDNAGLQFGNRSTGTYTNPYIKIYQKYIELTTKSKAFTDLYLNGAIDIPMDLFRVEYTLRDKKHFAKYNLNNTLQSMLNIPHDTKELICSHMFSYKFNTSIYARNRPRVQKELRNKDLVKLGINTPNKLTMYLLIESLKKLDFDYELTEAIEVIKSLGFSPSTERRHIKSIYDMISILPTKDQDKKIDNENDFTRFLVHNNIKQIGIKEYHYFANNIPLLKVF